MTRLDYGSAVLAGLPSHLLNRLQSVLNAAARLVCRARKYDHATYVVSAPGHALVTGSDCCSDWPYWLSAVVTTRRLRISLTSSIGLTRRNHGIDYALVPVHA